MVKCACCIEQNHGKDKNADCHNMKGIFASGSFYDQRGSACNGKEHGDAVSDGASRVF